MTTSHTLSSSLTFSVALWMDVPPPAEIGSRSLYPFTLYLSAEDPGPHVVELYAQNSGAVPWQSPRHKWSHLIPQWRFTDVSEEANTITSITPSAYTPVVNASGVTIGYTASAHFFYIDDISTAGCNPIVIWATMMVSGYPVAMDQRNCSDPVPGYANTRVIVAAPYYINAVPPDRLEVRRDGANPLFSIYWLNTQIQHVITVHGRSVSEIFCPGSIDVSDSILFDLPISNAYGVSGGPVQRHITGLADADQVWVPDNSSSYLSAYDSRMFSIGGYLRSVVTPESAVQTATLTAGVSVYFEPKIRYNPYIWVSNPENNYLSRLYSPCVPSSTIAAISSFIELQKFTYADTGTEIYPVPMVTAVYGMSLSGFGGIYGMAVDPCYNLWAADAELDAIFKFDVRGNLLSSFYLHELTAVQALDPSVSPSAHGFTPAGIALDGIGNVWVSLFDSLSVLKFSAISGNLITAVDMGNFIPNIDVLSSGFTDPGFKPTLAEPDKDNNVWISYTNSLCSAIFKIDNNGSLLDTISLPTCSNPMDLLVDYNNDLWVSLTTHAGPPYLSGSVQKFDTSVSPPQLVSAVSAVNPEYLTMDLDGTLWFTYGFDSVGQFTSGGQFTSFQVGTAVPPPTSWTGTEKLEFNALEGIAADSFGRVYVIHGLNNEVFMYEGTALSDVFRILPDANLIWYNDSGYVSTSASQWAKSAQAFGDWTGLRWQIKYTDVLSVDTRVRYITGESGQFEIGDFRGFQFRRFNESWNAAATLHDFAIPPHIHDNDNLWGMMNAVWGGPANNPAFGRQAYERIANFVGNHADIFTCGVAQVHNHARSVDVPMDDYNLNYPSQLQRLMDLISINQEIVWGDRCTCEYNITNPYELVLSGQVWVEQDYLCPRCGHYHPGNRGELFSPESYMVTSYEPFILKDRISNNKFMLIIPPLSCDSLDVTTRTCVSTYPLSAYYEVLLPDLYNTQGVEFGVVVNQFCFYDYVPGPCDVQIAGVINWDDPYTTLSENESGIEDWFGDGETVEKMINFELHRGLGFIGD